jgi:hypothetical protein
MAQRLRRSRTGLPAESLARVLLEALPCPVSGLGDARRAMLAPQLREKHQECAANASPIGISS